jgi:hypothetical protein
MLDRLAIRQAHGRHLISHGHLPDWRASTLGRPFSGYLSFTITGRSKSYGCTMEHGFRRDNIEFSCPAASAQHFMESLC